VLFFLTGTASAPPCATLTDGLSPQGFSSSRRGRKFSTLVSPFPFTDDSLWRSIVPLKGRAGSCSFFLFHARLSLPLQNFSLYSSLFPAVFRRSSMSRQIVMKTYFRVHFTSPTFHKCYAPLQSNPAHSHLEVPRFLLDLQSWHRGRSSPTHWKARSKIARSYFFFSLQLSFYSLSLVNTIGGTVVLLGGPFLKPMPYSW